MKKLFSLSIIILTVFLLVIFNCQQSGSSRGGSCDNKFSLEVIKVAAGGDHNVAIISDGTVKCWGFNWEGELGYGDTDHRGDNAEEMGEALPTVNLGSGRTAKEVTAGYYHTAAVLDNGTVKCWGRNNWGQLGYGDTEDRGDEPGEMSDALPTVNLGTGRITVQIAAGVCHTAVLLNDGTVKCWGRNDYGQLGYGDTEDRGDEPGEMGDTLPTVNLGTGRTAVQIVAGYYHTVVLLDNGTVKCWGRNDYGQLGYGDTLYRGDNAGEMGNSLPLVDLGSSSSIKKIIASRYNTIALYNNGVIKCWGDNGSGQLGYGDTEDIGDEPGEMGDNLPFVDLW